MPVATCTMTIETLRRLLVEHGLCSAEDARNLTTNFHWAPEGTDPHRLRRLRHALALQHGAIMLCSRPASDGHGHDDRGAVVPGARIAEVAAEAAQRAAAAVARQAGIDEVRAFFATRTIGSKVPT